MDNTIHYFLKLCLHNIARFFLQFSQTYKGKLDCLSSRLLHIEQIVIISPLYQIDIYNFSNQYLLI
jgi:hypothetical protein